MLNNNYYYKINLKNKIYKKIINKFIKINNSLELLNEYNKNINNQIGGGEFAEKLRQRIKESQDEGQRIGDIIQRKIEGTQPENINTSEIEKAIEEKKEIIQRFLQANFSKIKSNINLLGQNTSTLNTEIQNLEDLNLMKSDAVTNGVKTNLNKYLQQPRDLERPPQDLSDPRQPSVEPDTFSSPILPTAQKSRRIGRQNSSGSNDI
jgi:hypothetical protein